MSSFNIILNSNNVIKNNNYANQLQFNFINGSFSVKKNMKLQLVSAQIPYSFYNISNYYQNNKFNVYWPKGTQMVLYNITLPDGFYSVDSINKYLKYWSELNNLYLIDNNGNHIYYINMSVNTTYYANEIILTPIPSSLPTNWTAPSGFQFPNMLKTPQIEILNNNFQKFLGFNYSLYPSSPQSTLYDVLSSNIPKSTEINSIFLNCNLVNNNVSVPSNVFDVIGIYNSQFGSNINYEAKINKKVDLKEGTYNNLVIQLLDDNLNLLPILDSNIILNLLITVE
jgi:hypothetical protein